MKDILKIAAVFIGTIVGAGLASGQEILQFFSVYGNKGFIGIVICCILYIVFSIVIVSLCFKYKFKSYNEIILFVFGKRCGKVVDIILTLFIFGGNIIMISGGGAMLHEYAGINKNFGMIIMIAIVLFISIFSTSGLITVNSIIVPLSTSCIIILGVLVFKNSNYPLAVYSISNDSLPSYNFFISAILYASFNLLGATGVICPLAFEIKSKSNFIWGCIIGSIVLSILASIINYSILTYAPSSMNSEIPNFFIACNFGKIFPLSITIIIWLEMLSTEISDIYSLSKRIKSSFNIPYYTCILIILVLSFPLSSIGFSKLIKLVYPPFGIIGFIFLIGCFLKFFKNRVNIFEK